MAEVLLEIKGLEKTFPGVRALKGVQLTVNKGEVHALMGENGAGKSTLIKVLTGIYQKNGGTIRFDGEEINARTTMEANEKGISTIYQELNLVLFQTVYENLSFAMRAIGASNRELRRRIPYVLQLVGLEQKGNRYPGQLSGGEQQRVAIARALVNNPSMIIADEPTGNLDPRRSLEIMTLLERINAMGTTMLVVTHERDLVNRFSKRVVAIKDGEMIRDGQGGYYRA